MLNAGANIGPPHKNGLPGGQRDADDIRTINLLILLSSQGYVLEGLSNDLNPLLGNGTKANGVLIATAREFSEESIQAIADSR